MKGDRYSRRTFMRNASVAALGALAGKGYALGQAGELAIAPEGIECVVKNARINQSVAWWPYKIKKIEFETLCAAAKKMGIKSIEFLKAEDLATVKKYGLSSALLQSHDLKKGMNNKDNHAECIAKIREGIDAAAEYGYPNVISFSGNGDGISDEEGLANAAEGFRQIVGYAEKKKVTICVEYLNSKVNHPDYMFDHISWGAELCKQVGSESLKILYDIYHAQIMEGDIIRTIRENHQYIGHYHTAGNPGRNEIDENQEIYYPAIMRAILETGYTGFVGHEFIPKRDPLTSLAQAVRICDV